MGREFYSRTLRPEFRQGEGERTFDQHQADLSERIRSTELRARQRDIKAAPQAEALGDRLVMDAKTFAVRRDEGLAKPGLRLTEVPWDQIPIKHEFVHFRRR